MNRYRIMIAVENSGIEFIHARDGRSFAEILDAWFAAMHASAERAIKSQRAAMLANIKLQSIQHGVGNLAREVPSEDEIPVVCREIMARHEMLIFSGDEDGIGAAAVLPGVVFAIEQEGGS